MVGFPLLSVITLASISCRMEIDSYVQYKAMIICTGMHLLLLMFELLACDKLESNRRQVRAALRKKKKALGRARLKAGRIHGVLSLLFWWQEVEDLYTTLTLDPSNPRFPLTPDPYPQPDKG